MAIIYHLVPRRYFESLDPQQDYLPAEFKSDGFIHCTDGEDRTSVIATRFLGKLSDDLLVVFIDKNKLRSPVRFDDEERAYPHIYGPLNRSAIVKVAKMIREQNSSWIFPLKEVIRTES